MALLVSEAQKGAHPDRYRDQDRDLSEGIEPAEVDQHDVDDVASVSEARTCLREIRRKPRRRAGSADEQDQGGDERPARRGDDRIADLDQPGRQVAESAQLVEDEDEDHHGQGLDRELGHRQVGRAQDRVHHGGTVTDDTAKAVREVKAGRVEFKLDKNGNVAVPVGKFSFTPEALVDNGRTVIEAVVKARPATAKGVFVENVTLSATMSPGLKIDASSFIKI